MGVSIVVSRHVVNTSVGNQDFTNSDLGGLTPKAALFILTNATTDNTAANGSAIGIGTSLDTTDGWSGRMYSRHNVTTTSATAAVFAPTAISLYDPVAANADCTALFVSFITDGVRLNWTNTPNGAYLMTVILFAGTDLSAKTGVTTISGTVNVATDVNTVGFQPDVVIAAYGSTQGRLSVGFVRHSGGTVTHASHSTVSRGGVTTSEESEIVRNDYGVFRLTATAGNDVNVEFHDFDSSGFSMTPRNAAAANDIGWLALNFGGAVNSWVGFHTTPTTTGNASDTGPGFQPQFIMQIQTLAEAVNTVYSDSRGGSYALAAGDSTESYSNSISREDAVTTTNTQSLSDNILVNVPSHDGSALLTGTLTSFDANGWTTNYSAVAASAKLFPTLIIGSGVVPVKAPPLMHRPLRVWKRRRML